MQRKRGKVLVFLLAFVMAVLLVPFGKAQAGGKLTIKQIDYDNETLTVTSTAGDSFLYYSDAKMKNWECASGTFSNNEFVLDISWVKKTKDYVLTLKGDKSDEVLSVTLPMQNKYLKVTYNCIKEEFVATGDAGRKLYWRKADSTTWNPVLDENGVNVSKDIISRLYARGATLYLRTGQEMGDATKVGARPSKEVKVSLSKQATAPSLSAKTPGVLTVNDKQEYQVGSTSSTWTKCEKTLDLGAVATAAFGENGTDTYVYVRTAATEKKLPSANAVITVKKQEKKDVLADIDHSFKNSATLQLTITEKKEGDEVTAEKPSSKNPYEYTVVAADATNPEPAADAQWTAITSDTVLITSDKAPENSTVYVRKAGRMESKTVYQPESLPWSYTVGKYPDAGTIEATSKTNEHTSVSGEEVDGKTVVRLVKEEGSVSDGLEFKIIVMKSDQDVSSIICGGKNLTFTSTKSGNEITVMITGTSAYEEAVTVRDAAQPVKITLKDGEVLDKQVTLEVLRGASVQGEKTFEVTHGVEPTSPYEFVVVPGWKIAMEDSTDPENKKHLTTAITGIKFMDESLTYDVATESNGSYKITITAAAFNNVFLKSNIELEKAYPLVIEMENGQKIKSGVSVKLYENAKADKKISINKKLGTPEEDLEVVTLTCTKSWVSLKEATWNGIDILVSARASDNEITATLDLNKLTLDEGVQTLTLPVIFVLDEEGLVSQVFSVTLRR